jgi:hypothetical protein
MPREVGADATVSGLETHAAAVWAATMALYRDAARPVAAWCAQQMRLPLARLPSLPQLRALRRDDGLWLAARLSTVTDRTPWPCGVFLMHPETPITEILGARGFIPLTHRVAKTRWRDGARHQAVIVVGLPDALAIAGAQTAPPGKLFAVPDALTLLEIELPAELRCLVIAYFAGDRSFGDGPTLERAVARFKRQGRRVRIAEGEPDG